MIRQLLLDIDDTLLDFSQAEGWALRQAFAACGLALSDDVFAQYRQINRRQWQRLDAGEIPRDDVLYGRFRLLFAARGWRADPVAVETRYRSFLAQAHFPVPGALEALEALHQTYPLYIASNGLAQTQYDRLDAAGMTPYLQGIFLSEAAGAPKPEPAFFDYCFAHMPGARREETLLIGDNLRTDIRGGQRAGLRTCWFNARRRPEDPAIQPNWTVYSWAEVLSLL